MGRLKTARRRASSPVHRLLEDGAGRVEDAEERFSHSTRHGVVLPKQAPRSMHMVYTAQRRRSSSARIDKAPMYRASSRASAALLPVLRGQGRALPTQRRQLIFLETEASSRRILLDGISTSCRLKCRRAKAHLPGIEKSGYPLPLRHRIAILLPEERERSLAGNASRGLSRRPVQRHSGSRGRRTRPRRRTQDRALPGRKSPSSSEARRPISGHVRRPRHKEFVEPYSLFT
jgi:hypothetical protein